MSRFVLDASVVLAWCFPDEDSPAAKNVAACFERGDSAIVTSFWPHEVLNALLMGEKRKRISSREVDVFLRDLAILPITSQHESSPAVFIRVRELASKCSLTAYDAAYLDLALELDLPLATLDRSLIEACKTTHVRLLDDNPSA